jgi:toxin ParE1/3/4
MRRTAPWNSVAFLISRTRLLARSPELGRIVPEFEEPSIREIIVGSYRVVYRLNHSRLLVEVVRFWHAARGTPDINA